MDIQKQLEEANRKFDSIKYLVWEDVKKHTVKNAEGHTVITKDDYEWGMLIMSMFTLQDKQVLKSYVAEVLVTAHNFDASTVHKIIEGSAFSKTLETDPEFVFHYEVEHWAEKVKNEQQNTTGGIVNTSGLIKYMQRYISQTR